MATATRRTLAGRIRDVSARCTHSGCPFATVEPTQSRAACGVGAEARAEDDVDFSWDTTTDEQLAEVVQCQEAGCLNAIVDEAAGGIIAFVVGCDRANEVIAALRAHRRVR